MHSFQILHDKLSWKCRVALWSWFIQAADNNVGLYDIVKMRNCSHTLPDRHRSFCDCWTHFCSSRFKKNNV